ncbi:Sel1 repeat protein [Schistosoma japonicum]|nr:Sel1 repeat protein [Schistosoma japonicum]
MEELNEHGRGLRRRKSITYLKLSHSNQNDQVKLIHKNGINKSDKTHSSQICNKSGRFLSYGDKIPFAPRKNPDSQIIQLSEITIICGILLTGYLVYNYSDRMYLPIMKFYANLGIKEAQNRLSQYLLYQAITREQYEEALYWLKISAIKNKNPIASYNYVIAHIKDHVTESYLTKDEVNDLLIHALNNGVSEAEYLLNHCNELGNEDKLKNIVLPNEQEDDGVIDYLM